MDRTDRPVPKKKNLRAFRHAIPGGEADTGTPVSRRTSAFKPGGGPDTSAAAREVPVCGPASPQLPRERARPRGRGDGRGVVEGGVVCILKEGVAR